MLFTNPCRKGQKTLLSGQLSKIKRLSAKVLHSQSTKTGLSLFHFYVINAKDIALEPSEIVDAFLKHSIDINAQSNKAHGFDFALFNHQVPQNCIFAKYKF